MQSLHHRPGLLELLKALIQVKAHTRKDGTQVKAHQRNIQSRAERRELVEALARNLAAGEHTRHATLASAVGAARYASRANGKAVHVYEHPDGGWVATHGESHTAGHDERIVAAKGKARLHRAGEASRSLAHLKGPIIEHVEKPAPAPRVKPARPAKAAGGGGPRGEREYKDVGEKIGAARKDVWAGWERGQKNFRNIDWDEMKRNPEEAAQLVTKKNLLGDLSPETMRAAGMSAQAAFLLTTMLRSIDGKPGDTPDERYRYAKAIDRLTRALQNVETFSDLRQLAYDMYDETRGVYGSPDEVEAYRSARQEFARLKAVKVKFNTLEFHVKHYKGELERAARRKNAADMATFGEALAKTEEALKEYGASHAKDLDAYDGALAHMRKLRSELIAKTVDDPHPWKDCYATLGKSFMTGLGALYTGESKNSTVWLPAQSRAAKMKPDDWTWTEKATKKLEERTQIADAPLTLPVWQRQVPEQYERTGGKPVDYGALSKEGKVRPEGLMQAFGLRGVEYGNWVTQDEAAHHTQRAGEALQDLATILDLSPEQVSYGKRLALAIGARGKTPAMAHYEADRKVINLTKMNGGGTLAHEWGHFLDNIVAMVSHGGEGGHMSFATDLMGDDGPAPAAADPRVAGAIQKLVEAMEHGAMPHVSKVNPRKKAVPSRFRSGINVDELLQAHSPQGVVAEYAKRIGFMDDFKKVAARGREGSKRRLSDSNYETENARLNLARKLKELQQVAQYVATKTMVPVWAPSGEFGSAYAVAARLQDGERKVYLQDRKEMFARAFEAYVQDKSAEKGIRNNYLVHAAAVSAHQEYDHPIVGPTHQCVYPSGEERTRINAAMDGLMTALRETGTLQKALAAIAGPSSRLLFARWF